MFPESEWISFDNLGVALKVVVGGQKGETGIPALFRREWMKIHNALSTKKVSKLDVFFQSKPNHCRFGSNCFLESLLFVFVPLFAPFPRSTVFLNSAWQERL